VSLDPPLILVCVDHKSQSYPALAAGKMFAVTSSATTGGVSGGSRRRSENKFEGVPFTLSGWAAVLDTPGASRVRDVKCTSRVTIDLRRSCERASGRRRAPVVYFRGRYDRSPGPTRDVRPAVTPPVDDEISRAVLAAIDSRHHLGPAVPAAEVELASRPGSERHRGECTRVSPVGLPSRSHTEMTVTPDAK